MRVLFVGVGLVHYYNNFLNRLNEKIEVYNLVSKNTEGHVQSGVYQSQENIKFKVLKLREFKLSYYYRGFVGTAQLIKNIKPDIVVCTELYIKSFLINPINKHLIKILNIKVLMKSIPFRVKLYTEERRDIKNEKSINEIKTIYKGFFHFKIKKTLKKINMEINKYIYNSVNGHIAYIEDAYKVYGSYGVNKGKILVTGNTPDTDLHLAIYKKIAREEHILPKNLHRIIHIGRLVRWKRVDLLIEAIYELKKTYVDIELVVIGDGPLKDQLISKAKKLYLLEHVKFLNGIYDPTKLGQYLLASSIYVLAGMGGISINDAMCYGKPIICSVCDGTEKVLVKEKINGYYFKEGNLESLVQCIDKMFSDRKKLLEMGNNSIEIIKNEMNIHIVMEKYMKAFNWVLNN